MNDTMNKLLAFAILCLYVLGTIGGLGYLLWLHKWAIAVGVLALAVLAWPKFLDAFKQLAE